MRSPIDRNPISAEGRDKLSQEIEHLRRNVRPGLVQAVSQTARAHGMGDISAAKTPLMALDHRLATLEHRLANCVVIDMETMGNTGSVRLGNRVVCRVNQREERVFIIACPDDANPAEQRISLNSPIAQALSGAIIGDAVTVSTPRGAMLLEVIAISRAAA